MAEKEPLVYTPRKRFFLEEKRIVALKVQEYYSEYQREVQVAKERVNFNEKRKKHTTVMPTKGYVARAVTYIYIYI